MTSAGQTTTIAKLGVLLATATTALLTGGSGSAAGPGSALVTFVTGRTGTPTIVSRGVNGGPLREIVHGDHPQWSPDGRKLLFTVSKRDNVTVIHVMDADGRRAHVVATVANSSQPSWSPDGRRLSYLTAPNLPDEQLHVVDADGRHDHAVGNGGSPSWSPDATMLAFCDLAGEIVVSTAGGHELRVLSPPTAGDTSAGAPPRGATYPAWSPDGRWIAVVRGRSDGQSSIMLVRPDGRGRRTLVANARFPTVAWSPDGTQLAYGTTDRGIFVFTLRTGTLRSLPRLTGAPVWSPDGRWLAVTWSRTLAVVRPDGTQLHTIATNAASYGVTWSPDSRSLAMAIGSFPADVWVVGLDGKRHAVSSGARYGYANESPAWAPAAAASLGHVVSPRLPSDSRIVGTTLLARWPITELAADGGRIAVFTFSKPNGPCTDVWTVGHAPAVRLPGCVDRWISPSGLTPDSGAFAGDRVWMQTGYHYGGVNNYRITLSTLEHPGQITIHGVCPYDIHTGGICTEPAIGDLVADETLTVFDGWMGPEFWCMAVRCPPAKENGVLYRIDGTHAVVIATADDGFELTPIAVDGDRILVNRGTGGLSVYDRNGNRQLTLSLTNINEGALAGNDLVAHSATGLQIFDSHTGVAQRTCPLPDDAHLDGAAAGLAAITTPDATAIVRLTDCRTVTVADAPPQPDLARITTAGLFSVQANSDPTYPFRVKFTPTSDIDRRLAP